MTGHPGISHVRRVLDKLPQALLLVDLDGRVVHANAGCSDILAADPDDLQGSSLRDLVADDGDHVDELLTLWSRSAQPRPGVLRVAPHAAEGPTPVHAEGSRLTDLEMLLIRCREREAALDGFDALSREVETRNLRQMKRRLETTIDELRSTNRRLQDANEELDRYAAVVSHDLRTPLTTIAGFVDLLQLDHADDLDEEGRHIIDVLRRNTERMAQAIDALLKLARTEDPPEHVPPLDPEEVVSDVVEQIGREVVDADIEVGDLPTVAVDRTHLHQVIQNLLANSLRYRSPDRPLRIRVSGRAQDGMIELAVSDTGIGIPDDERDRVFEPLRRGRAVQDVIEGSGIGLATCRKIVRSYGGDIGVVDQEGPGTTIAFTIPAP